MRCSLKYCLILPLTWLICSCNTSHPSKNTEETAHSDSTVFLENGSVRLRISMLGGFFTEFTNKAETDQVNVLSGKQVKDSVTSTSPLKQGHFLSVGRWGKPTPGEAKAGMPYHGEPASNWWTKEDSKNPLEVTMSCDAPLDGLTIKRQVSLSPSAPLFKVTETIENNLPTRKITTIVQNVFFASPFYDTNLTLNSNATYGYNQTLPVPYPYTYEYKWPKAFIDTLKISFMDLQKFSNTFRYISSHIFSDSIGWITAFNPKSKLLFGYVWRTEEYPWLHILNDIGYGKPSLRGIAFGTTGLGEKYPYEQQLATTFHMVRNFDYIDAKSFITKSWYCFLVNLTSDYIQTRDVSFSDKKIIIKTDTYSGRKEYSLSF
jgi:hypothetical protein